MLHDPRFYYTNKFIVLCLRTLNSAKIWFYLQDYTETHGQQNRKFSLYLDPILSQLNTNHDTYDFSLTSISIFILSVFQKIPFPEVTCLKHLSVSVFPMHAT